MCLCVPGIGEGGQCDLRRKEVGWYPPLGTQPLPGILSNTFQVLWISALGTQLLLLPWSSMLDVDTQSAAFSPPGQRLDPRLHHHPELRTPP